VNTNDYETNERMLFLEICKWKSPYLLYLSRSLLEL